MTWRCTPADYRDRRPHIDAPLGPPPPSLYRNAPRPATTDGIIKRPRLPYSVISGAGQVSGITIAQQRAIHPVHCIMMV